MLSDLALDSAIDPTTISALASSAKLRTIGVEVLHNSVPSALIDALNRFGAKVGAAGPGFLEAEVPIEFLGELGALPGVRLVRKMTAFAPATISEGAAIHLSPRWNTAGFTGTGVRVGVIDVGFEGYSSLVGSELPSPAGVRCYTWLGGFSNSLASCEIDSVHGTAVAEAIIDIAPQVQLYLSQPSSTADLQSAVEWMVSQDVDIINHSVGWEWVGSGDGTANQSLFPNNPLKAVDTAVAGGAIWINAAGNDAQDNWRGSWVDSDLDDWLNFSGTDETNTVQLAEGEKWSVELRLEDSWGGADTDLDLYIYDPDMNVAVLSYGGKDMQTGDPTHVPHERAFVIADVAGSFHVEIKWFSCSLCGPAPDWVQLRTFPGGQDLEYQEPSFSIGNPAESASTGMLAVGAASHTSITTIEPFSSQGPTNDGRIKPDITAVDRGDSASYGPGGFAGTSQASPHVAGMAALVLDRFPAFTAAQVAEYLKSHAAPRGTVPNNTWGYGFAQLGNSPPGPPQNVSATAGLGQASVSWDAPTEDGGTTVTGYRVTASPGGITADHAGGPLGLTIGELTPGTTYSFTVTASNWEGTGPVSLPSNNVTVFSVTPGVAISGTVALQGISASPSFDVVGPTVTLINLGGGATSTVLVNADLNFEFAATQDGTYNVVASGMGFLSVVSQGIIVSGSGVTMQPIELRAGDVDGDGVINIRDISAIAASFGSTLADRLDGSSRPVDLNADGIVDILDVSGAASNFGATGPLYWPE